MISSEKKLKELAGKLNSNNPNLVIETISLLRNEDPFSGAIQLLVDYYDKSDNQAVRNKIRDFMNDLKESSARQEVMGEVKKVYKQSTIAMLVSSCWQSGLDYSSFAPDLAVAFNNGDYATALECFTVIEEFSGYLSRKTKDQVVNILRENEAKIRSDKSSLMLELVSILS
jgi:hypothetical protein